MTTESETITVRKWWLPALPPESRVFTINRGEVFVKDLTDDDRIVAKHFGDGEIEVQVRVIPPPTKISIHIDLNDLAKETPSE